MIDKMQMLFLTMYPMWIRAFAFTLLSEAPAYTLLGRKLSKKRCPYWRAATAGALGSCITHPLLWFVWPLVVHRYTYYVISGELIVTFIEACVFYLVARPIAFSRAVLVSIAANATSFALGLIFHKWILGV